MHACEKKITFFYFLFTLEYISAKDKRRLQNVMAYGEHGKDLEEDKPRRRRTPQEERDEPEVDRFEEGSSTLLNKDSKYYCLLCW